MTHSKFFCTLPVHGTHTTQTHMHAPTHINFYEQVNKVRHSKILHARPTCMYAHTMHKDKTLNTHALADAYAHAHITCSHICMPVIMKKFIKVK